MHRAVAAAESSSSASAMCTNRWFGRSYLHYAYVCACNTTSVHGHTFGIILASHRHHEAGRISNIGPASTNCRSMVNASTIAWSLAQEGRATSATEANAATQCTRMIVVRTAFGTRMMHTVFVYGMLSVVLVSRQRTVHNIQAQRPSVRRRLTAA